MILRLKPKAQSPKPIAELVQTMASSRFALAVAVAMAKGLEVGLARVDALDASDTRGGYCLLPA